MDHSEKTSGARFVAALRGPDARRAFWVALVVGTALNLINQGDAFLVHQTVNWWKVGLTYLVPFFVSLHGAIMSGGSSSA